MRDPLHGSGLVLLAGAAAVLAFFVLFAHLHPPSGAPQPVGWNRDLCAQCGMIVGDRHFAAQLQTADGQALNFDDPGCLMNYLAMRHASPRAIYFRRLHGDGWLTVQQAAFVPVPQSPSGFNLGAVPRGTPGSIPWEQAVQRAQRMEHNSLMEMQHVH